MARGNTYACRTCGKKYDYCSACSLFQIPYLEDGFCCEDHSKIFAILSKHGCHLATAEETLAELGKFTIPAELVPSIKAHIDAIKAEVKPMESKPVEVEETPVEERTFFKKK